LASEIIQVRAADLMRFAPLRDLKLRSAQQYGVQIMAGALVFPCPVGQPVHPASVLRNEEPGYDTLTIRQERGRSRPTGEFAKARSDM
jgi:hypothetical protein